MIRKLKALAAVVGMLAAGIAFIFGMAAVMCIAQSAGISL